MLNSRITVHLARQFLEKQIDLSGYSECDSEAASILATYQDGLDLNGLIHLDDATADALSTHVGWLYLCGLTEISDFAACKLAENCGGLMLDGLSMLSDAAIANHRHRLCFGSLRGLSNFALRVLRQNPHVHCLPGE